jgi:hypothetical protein
MERCLSLSSLFLVLPLTALVPRSADAQEFYTKVVPNTLKRITFDNSDSTIYVMFGAGTFDTNAVFHPDKKTHTYLIASEPPITCTLNAPVTDTFMGIDTIAVTVRNYVQGTWGWDMQLRIDGNPVSAVLNAVSTHFDWPDLTDIGNYARLEVGSKACFNYYQMRNNNSIPIAISRVIIHSSDPLLPSPTTIPRVLQPGEEMIFQVCASAPRAPDTLTGKLEIDLAVGVALQDTIRRDIGVYVVPLYGDHCLQTSYAQFGPIYPWSGPFDTAIYLTNRLATPISVNEIKATTKDSIYFTLTGRTPPFTIPGGAVDSIHVRFQAPPDSLRYDMNGTWDLSLEGLDSNGFDCPSTYFQVWCNTVTNFDRIWRELPVPSSESVDFRSFGQKVYQLVMLRSTASDTITLSTANITGPDASAFFVEHAGYSPGQSLSPGDSTFVYLSFPSERLPYREYHAALNIDLGSNTATIPLRGNIYSIGVTDRLVASSANLIVRPNPNKGSFDIELPATGCDITLIDALGRTIASKSGVMTQRFSSDSFDQALESGSYIVRVTGTDSDGRPFVVSRRITIQR